MADRAVNFAVRVVGADTAKNDFMAVGKAASDTIEQVAATAKAQASFEAATARANAAAAAFGAAQADAAQNVTALKAQLKAGEIGVEQYTVALRAEQNALALVQAENRAAATAVSTSARAVIEAKTASGALVPVLGQVVSAHGRMSASSMILMHAVRATSDSFAAGTPLTMILGTHIGMLAEAAAMSGGAMGKFGAFMGGPWGLAITGAVAVLGTLISKVDLFGDETSKATEKLKEQAHANQVGREAQEAFNTTLDGAIEREHKLTAELDKQLKSRQALNAENLTDAQKNLRDVFSGNPQGKTADDKKGLGGVSDDYHKAFVANQAAQEALHNPISSTAEVLAALAEAARVAKAELAEADKRLHSVAASVVEAAKGVKSAVAIAEDEKSKARQDPTEAKRFELQGEKDRLLKAYADPLKKVPTDEFLKKLDGINAALAALGKTAQETAQFLLPVSGRITGAFNAHRAAQGGVPAHEHAGIDIAVPVGTAVKAPQAGTVIEAGTLGAYGNVIFIDHGGGTITRLAHLSKLDVVKGQTVQQGDVIGLSGGAKGAPGSGDATGPHLHYEVRVNGKPVDPSKGAFPIDSLGAAERSKTLTEEAKRKADAERDKETRRREQFDNALATADKGLLEAKKANLRDDAQLADIARQEVLTEQGKLDADVDAKLALGDYTKAQAAKLHELYAQIAAEKLQTIANQESQRKADELLKSQQEELDSRRELLSIAEGFASTAADRRRIQLRLLELDRKEEELKLQNILNSTTASTDQKNHAADSLSRLPAKYDARGQAILNDTASPLAKYVSDIDRTKSQMNEAIQSAEVKGLENLTDGLTDAIVHFRSLGDVARSVFQGIASDILHLEIERYITAPLAKALFPKQAREGQDLASKRDAMVSAATGTGGDALTGAAGGATTALTELGTAATTAAQALATMGASGSIPLGTPANDTGAQLAASIEGFGGETDKAAGALARLVPITGQFGGSLQQLMQMMLSSGGGGAGGGMGGLLSSVFGGGGGGAGLLGSLFGGSLFGGQLANDVFAAIPGFASGTDYAPGGLAWVGERGPELLHLPTGSKVTPMERIAQAAREHEMDRQAANAREIALYRGTGAAPSAGGYRPTGAGPAGSQFHSEQQAPARVTVIQNFKVPATPDPRRTPSSLARDAQRGIVTAARKGLAVGPRR